MSWNDLLAAVLHPKVPVPPAHLCTPLHREIAPPSLFRERPALDGIFVAALVFPTPDVDDVGGLWGVRIGRAG